MKHRIIKNRTGYDLWIKDLQEWLPDFDPFEFTEPVYVIWAETEIGMFPDIEYKAFKLNEIVAIQVSLTKG